MSIQVKIVGWLWIIMGSFGILGSLCLSAAIAGGGLISEDETAIWITLILAGVCGSLIFLENIMNLIVGFGLLKYKSWARNLVVVLGIINLFGFPLGTALGIYTLWAMFNQETKQLFIGRVG
jgi:hypothetical protein